MTRTIPLLLLVLSAAILGGALLSQYAGGLQPCELCLYQRWPYLAVIALMLPILAVGRRRPSRLALLAAAAIFIVGGIVAFYHLGVERHWFAGPGACTAPAIGGGSTDDLMKQLLATPVVRCDEPQWTLFGIDPLVVGNLLASALLAALSFILFRRTRPAR